MDGLDAERSCDMIYPSLPGVGMDFLGDLFINEFNALGVVFYELNWGWEVYVLHPTGRG